MAKKTKTLANKIKQKGIDKNPVSYSSELRAPAGIYTDDLIACRTISKSGVRGQNVLARSTGRDRTGTSNLTSSHVPLIQIKISYLKIMSDWVKKKREEKENDDGSSDGEENEETKQKLWKELLNKATAEE